MITKYYFPKRKEVIYIGPQMEIRRIFNAMWKHRNNKLFNWWTMKPQITSDSISGLFISQSGEFGIYRQQTIKELKLYNELTLIK